jgi:hypothetical protein
MGERQMKYIWIALIAVTAFGAGRGVIRWTLAAYFFGWFVAIPLLLMPKKLDVLARRLESIKNLSEEHVVKQEFKDVDNVDDLFKQLEKPKG